MAKKFTVQDALKSREENRYTVERALKDREISNAGGIDAIISDLTNRYNASLSDYNNYTSNFKPQYGMNFDDTLESQRSLTLATRQLLRDVEGYSGYLDDEFYKQMTDSLESMNKGYDAMRHNAYVYSRYKNEDEYKQASIGWLGGTDDSYYTKDLVKARKDYLSEQENKLTQLTEKIRNASGEERKSLKEQKEAITASINRYKRSDQYAKDKYYENSLKSDFSTASKKRDYGNPTRDQLDAQDSERSLSYMEMNTVGVSEYDQKTGEYILNNGKRISASDPVTVPDKLGSYLSASKEDVASAFERLSGSSVNNVMTYDTLMQEGNTRRWHLLSDGEVDMYYYLYNTQGQEAAYKYLDDMDVVLGRRENEQIKKEYEDSDVLHKIAMNVASVPASVLGGVPGFLDDTISRLKGEEINPYSASHRLSNYASVVRGSTAEDINEATNNVSIPFFDYSAGDAYQALMSGADSLVGAGLVGRGFSYLMGMNSAVSTAQEMYNSGATNTQIALRSAAAGIAEAFFEYYSLDKLLSTKSPTTMMEFVKQICEQGGVELSEEMFTETANMVTDILVMRSQSEWEQLKREGGLTKAIVESAKKIGNAGIGGFISGGAMAGMNSGANLAFYNDYAGKYGSELYNTGMLKAYEDYAVNNPVSADTQALMDKMNSTVDTKSDTVDKLSGKAKRAIGKFADSVDRGIYADSVKAEIRSVLEQRGSDTSDGMVDAVYKYITNDADVKFASKEVRTVANEIKANPTFTGNIESRNAISRIGMVSSYTNKAAKVNTAAKTEEAVADKVADNGTAVVAETGKEVEISKVRSIDGGKMTLELSDGTTADSTDILYANSAEALAYETVLDLGCSTEAANPIVASVKSMDPQNVSNYMLGVSEAYRYGMIGQKMETISKNGFASDLTDSQLKFAYLLGRADANRTYATAQNAVNSIKGNASKTGRIVLSESVSSLTDRQKVSVSTMGRVVSDITHNNVVFYQSVEKDGKRVFAKDLAGHKAGESAPNGFYMSNTGTIYIDLNSGNMGEGTILYTAAHELGHFVKQWSPQKFKDLADFLVEEYGKDGVDVDALVKNQIAKANRNGRTLSYDDAFEEVVADSLETMFTDGNLSEKLAKLKAKDQTLLEKVKEFFTDLLAKIKEAYKGLDPQTEEGMLVKQMGDRVQKISDLFAEALVDAGETFSASESIGISIDTESNTVSPAMLSERTWTESEYVKTREKAVTEIVNALGVSKEKAERYIDSINSVARLIADDRVRLDYDPNIDTNATVLKPNSEYKWTVDMSTLCAKRLLFTGTFDAIQKLLPNTAMNSDDIVSLRKMMQEKGYEVACGICYVESTRREIGTITNEFIERYKQSQDTGKPISRINSSGNEVNLKVNKQDVYAEEGYTPTLADLNTTDIDLVKRDHPSVYDAYLAFMNARGQAKPKLLETRAEYKGEILKHFKNKSAVNARNAAGGLRLQSFSDFEVPHMIDMMQIVMDMSRVGLKSQAYTKVPDFAQVFGDTGVKINLSLIAKGSGLDADGNLIFDDVEGINHVDAFAIRDKYSKNVGTILVGKNDAHIIAAMADHRIDFIIPFHKSSWKESLYDALGLTGYDDYTEYQNEKPIDKERKIKNFDPSEYWDFTKSGDENAQIYLDKCREDGRIPKFPQFTNYPGYWKLLIDFKMYDNDGVGSPQEVVRPEFNMSEVERILREYKGGHRNFPVANDVVDEFVKDYKKRNPQEKYSDRDSEGTTLSKAQQEFFKDSKVRDDNGNLKVMFHGTDNAGFHVFDPDMSDDGISLFFTDSETVAKGYSGSRYRYEAQTFKSIDELNKFLADMGDDEYSVSEENGMYYLSDADDVIASSDSLRGIYDEFRDFTGEGYGSGNYAVYLNIKNPLVVDAKGEEWDELEGGMDTRDYAEKAKDEGYDGVIFNNIIDTGKNALGNENDKTSTVAVAFKSNQVKSVKNQNPTKDSDIRYSDRDNNSTDNRTLLANALAETAKNDIERKYISDYQANIEKINAEQEKLSIIRDTIREMSFSKGKRDETWKNDMKRLREDATKTANRINTYDKMLLKLESTKPLKDVIDRERAAAVAKARQESRTTIENYRKLSQTRQDQIVEQYNQRIQKERERRANKEVRDKIKKLVKDLRSRDFNPKANKYIPMSLIKPTNDLLAAINLDYGRNAQVSDRLALLKARYEEIASDPKHSVAYDQTVSDMITDLSKSIGDTSIYNMNTEQLNKTYNTISALMKTIRDAVKAHNIDTDKNLFEISMEMRNETASVPKEHASLLDRFINAQMRPETMFRRLAGFKKDSMWGKVYDMLNAGQTEQMRIEMEANKIFSEVFKDMKYVRSLSKDMLDIGLKDDSGKNVNVSRGMMLTIYKAMMNEDNLKHMVIGGITVPDIGKYYKGSDDTYGVGHTVCHGVGAKGISDLSARMTELIDQKTELMEENPADPEIEKIDKELDKIAKKREDLLKVGMDYMESVKAKIEKNLTAGDMKFLKAAEEFFDVFSKAELNKVTMELYGFEKASVKNYLPIHTDPNFRQANFEQITKDFNLENSGFMKDRVKATNPILLEDLAELINSQITKVARYCGLTIPVRDFGKIYGMSERGFKTSLQNAIASKFGTPGKKYIDNLMSDIVGSRKGETTFLDRARGNMAGAVLTLNPRVAFSQAASYPTAAAELGTKSLLKGMHKFLTSHDKAMIAKYTPLLYNRSKGADIELSDIKDMSKTRNVVIRKLNFLLGWIEAVDARTVGTLWYASQYYVNDNYKNLRVGTDEYYKKVAEVFNRTVERTQPNYSTMQRPDILRSPNALVKQLTMFMTQRLQNANIIYDAGATYNKYRYDYKRKANGVTKADVVEARGTFARSVASQVIASAMIVGLKFVMDLALHSMNAYRDEDKELTDESVTWKLLDNFVDTTVGNILGGSELYAIINSIINKETYYGITLNGVSAFTDAISSFVTLSHDLFDSDPSASEEESQKKKERLMEEANELAKSVCTFLGIPLSNAQKIANGIRYHIEDYENGLLGSFEAGVNRSASQDYGRLYDAITNGNEAEVTRLKEKYGDKYATEVRKTLAENDPRIRQAAEARFSGNLSEYKRIALEIKAEGNFSQDDIVSAINLEVNKLNTDKEESTTDASVKGLFKNSDFETAIEGNNPTFVSDIKQDIIDTKVANGKTEEEATKSTLVALRNVIKESFQSGDISITQAVNSLTSYGEMDYAEADSKVKYWQFTMNHPDSNIKEATVDRFYSEVEPYGISADTFIAFYDQQKNAKGEDADGDGRTDSGSKKAKILAIIDALPLTAEQKDVLYYFSKLSANTINEAPWH